LERDEYNVCLIDYRLGEETGIELIGKAVAAGCSKPLILLTGQGDREIDIEATEAGAADYLVKGEIESQTLERSIRYALANSKILENLRESEKRFRSVIESASDAIVLENAHIVDIIRPDSTAGHSRRIYNFKFLRNFSA